MTDLTLFIGNKNYSSWSLRPWVLARHLDLEFEEVLITLDEPDSSARILAVNPAGRLPALRHGGLLVWDSIAICEYLCELAGRGLPKQREARAMARSMSAEMHAGFQELRQQWPMNARARGRRTPQTAALLRDIARVDALWCQARALHGAAGPWLLGDYSMADAMYASVALRFQTYGAQLSAPAQQYLKSALADGALQEWCAAAALEPWTIDHDEVGGSGQHSLTHSGR
ncbi:MAG TPA: glutathione S-transferase family protein [Steroidobacteraceae bacterium]|nr:glutathione S-transferase family protein [Steroidobacteraceae bacterium]